MQDSSGDGNLSLDTFSDQVDELPDFTTGISKKSVARLALN